MYGLGMNNNGTGLVLASMALADHPGVMLPIIIYNLVQQVVAGVVGHLTRRTEPDLLDGAQFAEGEGDRSNRAPEQDPERHETKIKIS